MGTEPKHWAPLGRTRRQSAATSRFGAVGPTQESRSRRRLLRARTSGRLSDRLEADGSREGSHSAGSSASANLHEAAPSEILRSGARTNTMRRPPRPSQTLQPTSGHKQALGSTSIGSGHLSSASLVGANRLQRQARRQEPYALTGPPRRKSNQTEPAQMINWAQIIRQTTHEQPSGLATSSLARQLVLQQMRPTNRAPQQTAARGDAMQVIKSKSKAHDWHWAEPEETRECMVLLSDDKLEVCFHPVCAESTLAIRGSQPFRQNGNYYYWEVTIYDKIFGTSMMLGLCTQDQALHKSDYCNLIGLDQHGWSLSHKGLTWHDGQYSKYTNNFTSDQSLTVGLLFDTMRGELSYFLNGENLGVAFSGLNNCNKELFPVVGSTAKRTRMRLSGSYCGYISLFERTCYTILNSIKNEADLVQTLQDNKVPKNLIDHMAKLAQVCRSQTEKAAKKRSMC